VAVWTPVSKAEFTTADEDERFALQFVVKNEDK